MLSTHSLEDKKVLVVMERGWYPLEVQTEPVLRVALLARGENLANLVTRELQGIGVQVGATAGSTS